MYYQLIQPSNGEDKQSKLCNDIEKRENHVGQVTWDEGTGRIREKQTNMRFYTYATFTNNVNGDCKINLPRVQQTVQQQRGDDRNISFMGK